MTTKQERIAPCLLKALEPGQQIEEHIVYSCVHCLQDDPEIMVDGDLPERLEAYKNYRVELVNFELIDMGEFFVCDATVEDFKQRILDDGIQEFPVPVLDHAYSTIDGLHRLNALEQAGYTEFYCLVGGDASAGYE